MTEPRFKNGFTIEQRTQILAAYIGGEKVRDIAARFGCDPSYPGLLAKRHGVVLRSKKDGKK